MSFGGTRGDLNNTIGAAVPKSDGAMLPNRAGMMQHLRQCRQALAPAFASRRRGMAPATNSRTFRQVGRVNSPGKRASRDSRLSGRGDSSDGGMGSNCSIACVESIRPNRGKRWIRGPRYEVSAQAGSSGRPGEGKLAAMTESDPTHVMIAATFAGLDVVKSRGGYTLLDPRGGTPLARLKPIPQSDRFELFYWSDTRGRWRTFGDFERLRLTLERAHEIFQEETIFHIPPRR